MLHWGCCGLVHDAKYGTMDSNGCLSRIQRTLNITPADHCLIRLRSTRDRDGSARVSSADFELTHYRTCVALETSVEPGSMTHCYKEPPM